MFQIWFGIVLCWSGVAFFGKQIRVAQVCRNPFLEGLELRAQHFVMMHSTDQYKCVYWINLRFTSVSFLYRHVPKMLDCDDFEPVVGDCEDAGRQQTADNRQQTKHFICKNRCFLYLGGTFRCHRTRGEQSPEP